MLREQFLNQILSHKNDLALCENESKISSADLIEKSIYLSQIITQNYPNIKESCVALIFSPSIDFVIALLAVWISGHTAVPLNPEAPLEYNQYFLDNSEVKLILISVSNYTNQIIPFINTAEINYKSHKFQLENKTYKNEVAVILYTSGTTNKPKGVMISFRNIEAQIMSLNQAWFLSGKDSLISMLPWFHVHGLVNILLSSLFNGASLYIINKYNPIIMFDLLFRYNAINVLMAVPTIYSKLISYYDDSSEDLKIKIQNRFSKFRLMVCGSAALPTYILERFKQISDHMLLERYGMTELGMVLSNPYEEKFRIPGSVGYPLVGVQVRVHSETSELEVSGAHVFMGYQSNPKATQKSFTQDGWFKTGDIVHVDKQGCYKILGRASMDIIKSSAYKISALEIEDALLQHSSIKEAAVVGIDDLDLGQKIIAFLITSLDINTIKAHINQLLPKYKHPQEFIILKELPKNHMGKVIKSELIKNQKI